MKNDFEGRSRAIRIAVKVEHHNNHLVPSQTRHFIADATNGNFFGVQRADPVNFRIVDSRHGKRSFDLRNTQKLLFANGEYIDVGSSVSRKKWPYIYSLNA